MGAPKQDRRKAKCTIQAGALRHGVPPDLAVPRDTSQPAKVYELGTSWHIETANTHPMNGPRIEEPYKQERILEAGGIDHLSFDCDPKATAYSGQYTDTSIQGHETVTYTWNIHRGAVPETEVELIPTAAPISRIVGG